MSVHICASRTECSGKRTRVWFSALVLCCWEVFRVRRGPPKLYIERGNARCIIRTTFNVRPITWITTITAGGIGRTSTTVPKLCTERTTTTIWWCPRRYGTKRSLCMFAMFLSIEFWFMNYIQLSSFDFIEVIVSIYKYNLDNRWFIPKLCSRICYVSLFYLFLKSYIE